MHQNVVQAYFKALTSALEFAEKMSFPVDTNDRSVCESAPLDHASTHVGGHGGQHSSSAVNHVNHIRGTMLII